MNKILIPLDISSVSRKIIKYVRKFCPADTNEIIILQVLHAELEKIKIPPAHAALDWTPAMYTYFEARQHIEHETALLRQEHMKKSVLEALEIDAEPLRQAGYNVSIFVEVGEPVEQIESFIRRESIAMVAMTTHARQGIGRLLFGSISGRIIHDITTIPVMLLHPSSS